MFAHVKVAEELRKEFPKGTRIQLERMDDPFSKIPFGTLGTVRCVDDAATIHVNWDTGVTLGLVYGEDKYHKI